MKDKEKYIKGRWYKDRDGDFVKFDGFDGDGIFCDVKYTALVLDGGYQTINDTWPSDAFLKCIPMTIDEMKEFLPEEEWWTESTNEMFPIY